MNDTAVAVRESTPEPTAFAMRPRTLEEAMKLAEMMSHSDLVPAAYKGKPGNVLVCIQMGLELGMTPMRALRSIAVVNGRATLWGDEMLAMVLASGICDYVQESESTDTQGVCVVKRKHAPEHRQVFTLEDAKRAGLLGKQGPWTTATARMLKLRARGFALRDQFADVLAGLVSAEEANDIPPAPITGPVEEKAPMPLKARLALQAKGLLTEDTPESVPVQVSAEALAGMTDEQLEQLAEQLPATPPPAPASTPAPDHVAIKSQIRAGDMKTATSIYNRAARSGLYNADQMSELQDALKARVEQLKGGQR